MPEFRTILRTVAAFAVLSAILAVSVAVLNAIVPIAQANDLVHAFIEGFKACLFAILGLLGGRAATATRAK